MSYEVRTLNDDVLVRSRFETLAPLIAYLRSLGDSEKIVGVYELAISAEGVTTSKEMPCTVEGDLVVLGKPM